MRTNGYISILRVMGGGYNDMGEIEPAEQDWSEPIPCNIKTNTDTRKGVYDGGEYRHASFTVLIERPMRGAMTRVRLERFGEDLGEYDVLSTEQMPGMGRTQIIV